MIWAAVKGFLGGVWGYVVAGLATFVAILIALAKAKKAGRDEVVAETAVKEIEHAKQANEIDRDVATTKPDDVRERLRHYQRD